MAGYVLYDQCSMTDSTSLTILENNGKSLRINHSGSVCRQRFQEYEKFRYHIGRQILGHLVFNPRKPERTTFRNHVCHQVGCALFVHIMNHNTILYLIAFFHGTLHFTGDDLFAKYINLAILPVLIDEIAIRKHKSDISRAEHSPAIVNCDKWF